MSPRRASGFALTGNLLLVAGILGAVLVGAVSIQTLRLEAAHGELAAEQVARVQAEAAIEILKVEKQAAEDSLAARDAAHTEIRRLRITTGRRLEEVEHANPETTASLDCVVPEPIRDVLRNRRKGGGQLPGAPPPGNTAAPDPAPRWRSKDPA